MISTILSLVFAAIFVVELWIGIAVPGLTDEKPFIERKTHPGPYWFMMALQGIVVVGLPASSFFLK